MKGESVPAKIVMDTNLLVAARYNPNSSSRRLLNALLAEEAILLWSDSIKKEAEMILRKVKVGNKLQDYAEILFNEKYKIENPGQPPVRSEDPEDDKFLACAVTGDADIIVSNDHHLLDLKEVEGIPIFRPGQALKRIKEKRNSDG